MQRRVRGRARRQQERLAGSPAPFNPLTTSPAFQVYLDQPERYLGPAPQAAPSGHGRVSPDAEGELRS